MVRKELLASLAERLVGGRTDEARALTKQALQAQLDPFEILNESLMPAMQLVGERFSRGEAFLPELILSGNAMMAALELVEPAILAMGKQRENAGTVVIGTVEGDIHTLGKDIVATVLKVNGFAVTDLGMNVSSDMFVRAVQELHPDIVALSALMTTTMLKQREVIQMLQAAGVRHTVKVLVGGAPVTTDWALEIGADGTAPDAIGAVNLAISLLSTG